MAAKTRIAVKILSSNWLFRGTLLLFIFETGWLALTSRFPMAFDETYHFNLIIFFSHRLDPIVTHQTASTYKFGALVQNPSLLYHYLLSFPYRLIELFTKSFELQVIWLRFINIALAVASLVVIRKLLRLIKLSDGLANVVLLVFALTPIVTVLSAQINYDNLLILLTNLCIYQLVVFVQGLERNSFDTRSLLTLISLCLFASLVQFTFLPVLVGIAVVILWKIIAFQRDSKAGWLKEARQNWISLSHYAKSLLLLFIIVGSCLVVRIYGFNLVEHHSPVPQCNVVLSTADCTHYYAWDYAYETRNYSLLHPGHGGNAGHYTATWVLVNTFDLFGEIMPLQGLYYVSETFAVIVALLGLVALSCTIVNLKTMLRRNSSLSILVTICLIYVLALWTRNYHDYVHDGAPIAIDGRYLAPILVYLYVLLACGLRYTLDSTQHHKLFVKLSLAVATVLIFVYYGGGNQYITQIDPVYGKLSPTNHYSLPDTGFLIR